MQEKKLKFTATLGLVTVGILTALWLQEVGWATRGSTADSDTSSISERSQEELLEDMSGNKGYEAMTAEQKATFEEEQIKILKRLSAGE